MAGVAETFARQINGPTQTLLADIQLLICTSFAVPDLMEATAEALEGLTTGTEAAHATFLENLQYSLKDNHLRFTTEMDVECPIAATMKPSYESALNP